MVLIILLCAVLLLLVLVESTRRRRRRTLGLPPGHIVGADASELRMPTLRSRRLGLVGRPDHLMRIDGALVAVEQKPTARRAQPSHVMQLAAQCLLVQEVYGVRPAYGVLVLAGSVREVVPFTQALERQLLDTMVRMRHLLATDAEPGPRWSAAKCRACGFHRTCWAGQDR
jgi:CRISPR-associated exonuclease Cas4